MNYFLSVLIKFFIVQFCRCHETPNKATWCADTLLEAFSEIGKGLKIRETSHKFGIHEAT